MFRCPGSGQPGLGDAAGEVGLLVLSVMLLPSKWWGAAGLGSTCREHNSDQLTTK